MSLRALFLHPLGPALVLTLGALFVALSRRVLPDPLPRPGAARDSLTHVPPQGWAANYLAARPSELGSSLRILIAAAALIASVVLLLILRVRVVENPLSWSWQPLTVAGGALYWQIDGWNWLAALLILLLTLAALATGELDEDLSPSHGWFPGPYATISRAGGNEAERTLWLGAAALAFVCSSNVVTMASCWVLLDVALAYRLHPGEGAEPSGRAWSLLSVTGLALLGILVLMGEPGLRTDLVVGPFTPLALAFLLLVALVRSGVYPLHLWLTGPGRIDAGGRVGLHLIAPATGLWLLGRVSHAAAADGLRRPEWAALGVLALLGTALVAWAAGDENLRWRWIALNRASLVVFTVPMAAVEAVQAQVWLLATFVLGGGLLLVGMAVRAHWGWRVPLQPGLATSDVSGGRSAEGPPHSPARLAELPPHPGLVRSGVSGGRPAEAPPDSRARLAGLPLLLAALAVWGVPGTPGFFARPVLVFPTGLPAAAPLFVIMLIAEILIVAALWQVAVEADKVGIGERSSAGSAGKMSASSQFWRLAAAELGLTSILFGLLILLWGFFPQRLAALVGMPEGGSYPSLAWTMAHARRSVWMGLALSGVGGLILGLIRHKLFGRMRGWQDGIVTVVGLGWLYRAITGALAWLGSGLRYFASLGEGEGYVGWLLLAGAILWLLLRG